jgi:hypothetical protein
LRGVTERRNLQFFVTVIARAPFDAAFFCSSPPDDPAISHTLTTCPHADMARPSRSPAAWAVFYLLRNVKKNGGSLYAL